MYAHSVLRLIRTVSGFVVSVCAHSKGPGGARELYVHFVCICAKVCVFAYLMCMHTFCTVYVHMHIPFECKCALLCVGMYLGLFYSYQRTIRYSIL